MRLFLDCRALTFFAVGCFAAGGRPQLWFCVVLLDLLKPCGAGLCGVGWVGLGSWVGLAVFLVAVPSGETGCQRGPWWLGGNPRIGLGITLLCFVWLVGICFRGLGQPSC